MTVAFLVTAPPGAVNFAAISDPSYKATLLGFGVGAYLIILFATISTNAGNIYASALGITNIATRWKVSMRRLLLLSAVIVVPLALLPLFETNFVFTYIFFLDFLGAIVVPLWTLTLVDYFLVVAHDRLRGRRVLLLGPVGMGEAPPRPPGGTAGRGVRLIRTPEPWKAYIPVSQSLFVGEPYRSRLGHDTMAKRTPKDLRGPKIVAVPPGPKSKAAMARKERFITNAVKVALPIDVTAAEGPFVQDADGNVYIDLGGGIGVQTARHRPPSVIRAAKDELDRLTHISFMVATYAPCTDLAARMAEICPPGLTKSIFRNSGSEAIENAVKISRAATKRAWLVSFKTAFHGRTLLDISLTGKDKPYREGFGPLVREVILADYAYPYRDPHGPST